MFSIQELIKLEDIQLTSIADPSNFWTNDILYSFDTGRAPTKKFIESFIPEKHQTINCQNTRIFV